MIIGISGYKGTGKDLAGQVLIDKFGFEKGSFAAPIKDLVSMQFGISREMLEGTDEFSRKCREDVNYGAYGKTPRDLLKDIGAFYNREISETFWCDILEKKYLSTFGLDLVVTDVRFPCEVAMIEKHGGSVIRINRPGFGCDGSISERSLNNHSFSTVVLNDGTEEFYKKQIEDLMKVIV